MLDGTLKILLVNGGLLFVAYLFRVELFRWLYNEAVRPAKPKTPTPVERAANGLPPPADPAAELAALRAELAAVKLAYKIEPADPLAAAKAKL